MGEKADIDGLRDPLTERFGLRQELMSHPKHLLSSCPQLFGWFADYCRASGKIFWCPC